MGLLQNPIYHPPEVCNKMNIKCFFCLLARALAGRKQENGVSNKAVDTWWTALTADGVRHTLPNLRASLLASNAFTPWWPSAWGPTHQMQRCPLGSMPADGSSSSRTVGLPSMHTAKHSYDREGGFTHVFCSPWHSYLQRAGSSIILFTGIRFWYVGNVVLEKANSHHPSMEDNTMPSQVALSTGRFLCSWKGFLICAMSIAVLIMGKTKHTFLVTPAESVLIFLFK